MSSDRNLAFHPLTTSRWSDFEQLFGERGAYGGCWCMWWCSTRSEFETRGNAGNRAAMQSKVESGIIPGILAYYGRNPIGWCSIAPRTQYGSLERSPVLKRIDNEPVWSIVCFYVHKEFRRQGIMGALIDGAVDYAAQKGARIIEAYPTISRGKVLSPVSSFMGLPEIFYNHGFELVAEPSKSRLIMRKTIPQK